MPSPVAPDNRPRARCTGRSKVRAADGLALLDEDGEVIWRPCKNWAMIGLTVCGRHGGSLPHMKAKSLETIQLIQLEDQVQRNAGDLLDLFEARALHPFDGLIDVGRRCYAMMRMVALQLAELTPVDLSADPQTLHRNLISGKGFLGVDKESEMTVHILVKLYGEWLDRYLKASKTALDAGIDERIVRNAEATTDRLVKVVNMALHNAGLNHAQQDAFKLALAEAIRVDSQVTLAPSS